LDETSQPPDILLSVSRGIRVPLGTQLEQQLRRAIRNGLLHPGVRLPSSRELARQLGVSRRVATGTYAQLAVEGYLVLRQGAVPTVATIGAASRRLPAEQPRTPRPRFDFRPNKPDLSAFPRQDWARCLRAAALELPTPDFDYGDLRGLPSLRRALADYLGRVRGVAADPARMVITSGFAQGRGLICQALAAAGARRIAVEDPSHPEQRAVMIQAGLQVIPVPVDEEGIRVEQLRASGADAVVITPAHQFPSGAVLSAARRGELAEWLRSAGALAIEDDYDAEYRYDRTPVGAVQGIEPGHIVYAGSVSKTLAPALRIGWLVLPGRLLGPVTAQKRLADLGSNHLEQHALGSYLTSGQLDRHLRRMRTIYRKRRDALIAALATHLPQARVHGIAAGLHATVELPGHHDEQAIAAAARRQGIALTTMSACRLDSTGPPTLLLGYAQHPEPTIHAGVAALAAAISHRSGTRR
jgi:GntR family transcriptional regulator / MocR family aminotransferase